MLPVVYTSPTCGPCKAVKMWLQRNNIMFTESQDLSERMAIDGKRTVPVVSYLGKHVEGFNIKELKEMFPE